MTRNIALTKLRDLLASLYSRRIDSERVVKDAGLDTEFIAFDDKAINNWSNILGEADNRNKLHAIIDVARKDYPEQSKKLDDISERLKNGEQLGLDISRGHIPKVSKEVPQTFRKLPIVDRDSELEAFITCLKGSPQQVASILLVQDQSGQGKTKLLTLYKEYCQDHNVPVALVDFKNSSLNPMQASNRILTSLRGCLPRCIVATERAADWAMLQHNYFSCYGSAVKKNQPWDTIAQALLEDLSELTRSFPQLKRFVFLFDTYDQATPETKIWITDHVLPMATPDRVSCLVVVLAGKQVPDPTGEWEPHYHPLPLPRLQPKDWIEFAKLVNAEVSLEQIELYYKNKRGDPAEMARMIDGFVRRG